MMNARFLSHFCNYFPGYKYFFWHEKTRKADGPEFRLVLYATTVADAVDFVQIKYGCTWYQASKIIVLVIRQIIGQNDCEPGRL